MDSEISRMAIDAMFEFQKEMFILCDKLRELDAAQKEALGQITRTEQNAGPGASGVSEKGQGVTILTPKNCVLPENQPLVPKPSCWLWTYLRPRARSN